MSGSPSKTDSQAPVSRNSVAVTPDWKDEIAARVRARRGPRTASQPALPGMEDAGSPHAVAARVAERFARLPSWRETMAAQEAAKSAVDSLVAAASAPPKEETTPQQLSIDHVIDFEPPSPPAPERAPEPYQPELLRYSVSSDSLPAPRPTPPEASPSTHSSNWMQHGYDPLEDAVVEPSQPLPATLLSNPRELVAPRKARPRLAEGPLCDSLASGAVSKHEHAAASPADTQAAEPESVSPGTGQPSQAPPLWHSIHLDTEAPIRESRTSPRLSEEPALHVASVEDRAMAAMVDCALTLCAFLLFCLVFALSSTHLPHGRVALIGACAILFAMGLLYQFLFFSLTDATPGMRYAKIALCTFDNGHPTRSALRGRIAALLLSALPLGLGFLWAVFDEDSLGWHDRITRMYQRSYRNS